MRTRLSGLFVLACVLAYSAGARADDVDLLHAVATDLAVSSTYRDQRAQLDALTDGDLETAWNSRRGELTTSWIEVRVPASARVTAIAMTAGLTHVNGRGLDLFTSNHRVRRVRISRDGAVLGEHTLDVGARALQRLAVSGGGGVYRVEIVETVAGSRADWREVCVSELQVMGTDPGARPGERMPRVAVGALPPPRVATPPDRAALLRTHRQRVAAFERSWLSIERDASSPRMESSLDELAWPLEMQSLVRTRRAALTALAEVVTDVDELSADALRSAAVRRVPLEWASDVREHILRDDLAMVARAMDALHRFLADDAARCRWARALGRVHLARATMMARGEAMFADQEYAEATDLGRPPTAHARQVDAFYALAEALTDAEPEWSRNTRGVAPRLRRLTPPEGAVSARDLSEVIRQLDVAQQTCGWAR